MSYEPCRFSREEYFECRECFENGTLSDVAPEMSEFNEDAESLAYELAYTRYALAKAERTLNDIANEVTNDQNTKRI